MKDFRKKILEAWEKPLGTGYSHDVDLEDAKDLLDNDEELPGDGEFPTYKQLTQRRNNLKSSNKTFTQSYSEFSGHSEGDK